MATRSALWFLAFCGFTSLTECFTFLQSPVHIIGAKVARRRRHSLRSGDISLKVSRMPPTDSSYTMTPKELESMKATQPKSKEEIAKEIARSRYLYPKHVEVIRDFEPFVEETTEKMLLETGENAWQPQDYLPDMTREDWVEQLKDFRGQAECVQDDTLVVLIGDMVTEEALPTYQTLLNTFEGCDDPTGDTQNAWAKWSRGWTSEENRHGDLLNKYLYLGGRCDMRKVEETIQHLITSGFNPGAEQDPYRGFVYTSFQERATKISHGNVAKLAKQNGDANLAKICAMIAGDEGRHEKAYQSFCDKVIERDPDGFIDVFADMMKGQIVMPAELMTDGVDDKLYDNFATVAQKLGVYTAIDYAEILEFLLQRWDLEHMTGLSAESDEKRDFLCRLPERYKKLATRSMNKAEKEGYNSVPFSWINGRVA
mmetsp:Transcript_29285/g.55334  ORF Transcript_29285/g.55334 Transcript_29285/m.55334 type:complete len:427 (-) Transcript_29285:110-1390(-)